MRPPEIGRLRCSAVFASGNHTAFGPQEASEEDEFIRDQLHGSKPRFSLLGIYRQFVMNDLTINRQTRQLGERLNLII